MDDDTAPLASLGTPGVAARPSIGQHAAFASSVSSVPMPSSFSSSAAAAAYVSSASRSSASSPAAAAPAASPAASPAAAPAAAATSSLLSAARTPKSASSPHVRSVIKFNTAEQDEKETFLCDICRSGFVGYRNFAQHNWDEHRRIEFDSYSTSDFQFKVFACRICGRGTGVVFNSPGDISSHYLQHVTGGSITYPMGSFVPGVHTVPVEEAEDGSGGGESAQEGTTAENRDTQVNQSHEQAQAEGGKQGRRTEEEQEGEGEGEGEGQGSLKVVQHEQQEQQKQHQLDQPEAMETGEPEAISSIAETHRQSDTGRPVEQLEDAGGVPGSASMTVELSVDKEGVEERGDAPFNAASAQKSREELSTPQQAGESSQQPAALSSEDTTSVSIVATADTPASAASARADMSAPMDELDELPMRVMAQQALLEIAGSLSFDIRPSPSAAPKRRLDNTEESSDAAAEVPLPALKQAKVDAETDSVSR